jgi:hypothetical protein
MVDNRRKLTQQAIAWLDELRVLVEMQRFDHSGHQGRRTQDVDLRSDQAGNIARVGRNGL